ncbi:lactate dehydrogenase [Acetobacter sacchari]|uniref:Lactate dehydrogenase n=1 Tax=Acetobacter sacchari TaxID=2661687 RepID=A0ABS3LWJ7_9PROT|nr:lactate dehydrogenase [Acetobacter sacchari]MBO1360263.1 lactate dehydrogenase [Acetobacter sacchari]
MSALGSQLSLFGSSALAGGMGDLFWDDLDVEAPVLATAPATPRQIVIPRVDFRLSGARALAKTWKERAQDNVAAIRLLATLDSEERNAAPDEQTALSLFTAFGAGELADTMFPTAGEGFRPGWKDVGEALHAATTDAERASLARATQYAHYTPAVVISALWNKALAWGFKGGSVLEPGCGTGLFIAARPEKLEGDIAFTGIEFDAISARIAQRLYPNQWIRHEDFTKARLASGYDLAIGNPPFSNRTVHSAERRDLWGFSLHDWFIARSIDALRPGGVALFVTSRYTMDKSDPSARRHIAESADFLGGVRLPAGTMRAEAGTDVVIDVLAFRKREIGDLPGDDGWLALTDIPDTDQGEGPLRINSYFAANSAQVLGAHDWTTTQFGPDYTCSAIAGADLETDLPAALARIAPDVRMPAPADQRITRPVTDGLRVGTAASGADLKEGSYFSVKGVLHQIIDGAGVVVAIRKGDQKDGLYQKHARIVQGLIPIRDAARSILRAQLENLPYGKLQADLRRAYHLFRREFGPINHTLTTTRVNPATGEETESQRRPNLQPFYDDPDVWLVSSIEDYDEERDLGHPGPIFSERVVHAPSEPEIHSAHDALAVCLHETGGVRIPFIAELMGRSEADVIAELGDSIFLDPERAGEGSDVWIPADEALSGAVRTKLAATRAAALGDPRFERCVRALEDVQPTDLRPSDVTARLGAPWIPTSDVMAFTSEIMGVETRIHHMPEIGCWSLDKTAFAGKAEATSVWGTQRRHAGELLEDALTQAIPKIWDTDVNEKGNEVRVLNTKETEAAKEKLAAIKSAFSNWVWRDADRADRLLKLYNETYNNLVSRKFDGSHLRLPGASTAITLRGHQKRVVWRIIATGNTYMAHAVGSGKTFSMCAAVMEQKRLGLISKAMITVPGHCLAQISREFLMLYPTARILVADETNFVKAKRQRFLARAATGNWDAIIITHDAFKFIATPAEFEREMISEQIASYDDLLGQVSGDDRLSRKRIERMKEAMKGKLEGLDARKDDLLHIGELGVDQILVDEAQQFRKLSYATNQADLKGVDPNGSQRAWDLFVKTQYLAEKVTNRPLVMASGSPITNTIAELWNVGRFMKISALRQRHLHEFDAWAANFGETRTELELQPGGAYKPVTRFTEFVNVADLMAMYRDFADVVQQDDLRDYVKLPAIRGGTRQIVVAPSNDNFKAYQKTLAERIRIIEGRRAKPQKGDDILLSVINDARHAAIDLRFVGMSAGGEERPSKLDLLINNVARIYRETSASRFTNPETGREDELPGAVQMVFSDLGTLSAADESRRGFSAYLEIRDRLVAMGVPRDEIAFMQHYKKSAAKLRLFDDLNAGRKRILIGSTPTMGTGVNAQKRLAALHHLDVPWLVSDIIQREGRIVRQGNQHDVVDLYAYAQEGSVDATSWGLLERKLRFISLSLAGDPTIRRLEDVNDDGNQFAMAKALASGDARLMQKAGLEADIARLERLAAAHYDDQFAVKRNIQNLERDIADIGRRIPLLESDIARRVDTHGDAFVLRTSKGAIAERVKAGAYLLSQLGMAEKRAEEGIWILGEIGGFEIGLAGRFSFGWGDKKPTFEAALSLRFSTGAVALEATESTKPLGLVSRIEHALLKLEAQLEDAVAARHQAERRLPAYEARLGAAFAEQAALDEKRQALAELEADLEKPADAPENDNAAAGNHDQAA